MPVLVAGPILDEPQVLHFAFCCAVSLRGDTQHLRELGNQVAEDQMLGQIYYGSGGTIINKEDPSR